MAFRICTDISEETRWMLDMQRENPIVQDFRRANDMAVRYENENMHLKIAIDRLRAENAELRAALIRLRDCPDVQMECTEPETDAARLQANAALGEVQS